MFKVLALMRRREGLSREAFERHLRGTHLPMMAALPELRRLVVNIIFPDPIGAEPIWDAIVEYWFDDEAALEAALISREGEAMTAAAPTFLDMSRVHLLAAGEEELALPGRG